MRFPLKSSFVSADPGWPATPTVITDTNKPNCLAAKLFNICGYPAQRYCAAWHSAAVVASLTAQLWLWDDNSAHWYKLGGVTTMTKDTITFWDIPTLMDNPQVQADLGITGPGALELALVPVDPAIAGTYEFIFGVDVSNGPLDVPCATRAGTRTV